VPVTREALPSAGPVAGVAAWRYVQAAVVVLLLFNGWMGWELVYKYRVGIADDLPIGG